MLLMPIYADTGVGGLLFAIAAMLKNAQISDNTPFNFIAYIDDGLYKAGPRPEDFNKARVEGLSDEALDKLIENLPEQSRNQLADAMPEPSNDKAIEVVKLLVIACNTLEIARYKRLQETQSSKRKIQHKAKYKAARRKAQRKHIIGISKALIEGLRQDCLNNVDQYGKNGEGMHIALFGTDGTIKSHYYQDAIKFVLPDAKVSGVACTDLAGMIDRGASEEELNEAVQKYVDQIPDHEIKTITHMAGVCTHYSILNNVFKDAIEQRQRDIFLTELGEQPKDVLEAELRAYEKTKINITVMDHPGLFEEYRKKFVAEEVVRSGEEVTYLKRSFFFTTGDAERMSAAAKRIQSLFPANHPIQSLNIQFTNVPVALNKGDYLKYAQWKSHPDI